MTPEPAVPAGPAGSGVFLLGPAGMEPVASRTTGQGTPAIARIRHLFTTRHGGVSAPPYDGLNLGAAVGDDPASVGANRARLAETVGLPAAQVVWMRQVHGSTVRAVRSYARVAGSTGGHDTPESDGIVTSVAGLALAVLVADCVPMLAGDAAAGVIAAVHAGRRGAAGAIALRALDQMSALGASARDVSVLLGPAICGACYEVPSQMRDEVDAALPGSASVTDRGTPGLDLRQGLARQLREAGVGQVRIDPRCTYSDPMLFSHRRGAPTGRFAGLIWMPR